MQSSPRLGSIECAMFRARARIVNLEAGLLALSLGGIAVGTDAPRTLAHLSMGIVMIFMVYRLRSFAGVYKLWREVAHPLGLATDLGHERGPRGHDIPAAYGEGRSGRRQADRPRVSRVAVRV